MFLSRFLDSLPTHAKGLLLTSLGVLLISPDSLLIRLIDTDEWTLLMWRGTGQGIMLFLIYRVWVGRDWLKQALSLGRALLIGSLFFAGTNIGFIISLTHTSVANTLAIVAATPMFAALLSWIMLREKTGLRTWLAIFGAAAGIGVIISASIRDGSFSLGGGAIYGDIAALVTAFLLAASFVGLRIYKDHNMMPCIILGAFIAGAVGGTVTATPLLPASSLIWVGLLTLTLPFATLLITLGPRYLPASEVSLLMLLETVLGPLLVWLFLAEQPPAETLLGGFIILAVLTLHSLVAIRSQQRKKRQGKEQAALGE
ncbi:DMT family transporter [Rhodovibrionaceae bacterium A322]